MAKARVVSDRLAKAKCGEWLEKVGYANVRPAKKQSCDLIAEKSDKTYYIEIKYSSKKEGSFFGTVMLTEMFKAIRNKDNYLFLVCRGDGGNIEDWSFKLFSVHDFLKCCTLTTPIFLYHLDVKDGFNLTAPKFGENSVPASEKLIEQMWEDFKKWKSKAHLSEGRDEL
jgi:hypothetical protein